MSTSSPIISSYNLTFLSFSILCGSMSVCWKSGSSYCFCFGKGTARRRSAPGPLHCPEGVASITPPPPENVGSMQHQCILSFKGAGGRAEAGLRPSSSSLSESAGSSDIRLGDLVVPGAHQNLFFSRLLFCLRGDGGDGIAESEIEYVKAECVEPRSEEKCATLARFRGIGLL